MARQNVVLEFKVDIIVEPDDGEFHAYCPALKGLHVSGDSEDQAVRNAADAAIAYLESLIKHGEPIPISGDPMDSPSRNPREGKTLTQKLEVSVA